MSAPLFFRTPADFRRWLEANHQKTDELWVGFYKKDSGKPSITWPESVDEALCVGWIDGIRKSIDHERYMIRFTPRRKGSIWSNVNVGRMKVLLAERRVLPAGLAAYEARNPEKTGIYRYEREEKIAERDNAKFTPELEATFRRNRKAWTFFQEQPPGYRKSMTHWVVSARQEATRERRLKALIAESADGERLNPLRPFRKA